MSDRTSISTGVSGLPTSSKKPLGGENVWSWHGRVLAYLNGAGRDALAVASWGDRRPHRAMIVRRAACGPGAAAGGGGRDGDRQHRGARPASASASVTPMWRWHCCVFGACSWSRPSSCHVPLDGCWIQRRRRPVLAFWRSACSWSARSRTVCRTMPLWLSLGLGHHLPDPQGGCAHRAWRMSRISNRSSPRSSRCRMPAGRHRSGWWARLVRWQG